MSQPSVIIGSGISGLAAAYYLSRQGAPAIVFDPRPRPGGVIQTERIGDFTIDGGPDSFLATKPEALNLIRDLGIENEVISSNDHQRKTYIVKRGRMVELPEGVMMMVPTKIMPMALSPLLGFGTKIRMGLEYFRKPGPPTADQSIAEFIEDHYGAETVEYLAEPLLSGVYGGDPRALSIRSVLPRFAEMADKYGSLTRGVLASLPRNGAQKEKPGGALFRTMKNGLGEIVDTLIAALGSHVEFRRGTVEQVEPISGGYRIRAGGDWLDAASVIVACEAYNAAKLFNGRLAELLRSIAYSSSIVVAFGFDNPAPMPGFGFLVPAKERRQIVACTWLGAKFNHRAPEGKSVARCFLAGESEPDVDAVYRELSSLSGLTSKPIFHRVWRWPRAMAQYTVGHAARVAEIQSLVAQMPGLYLAGNAYAGIGIPDCIRGGKQAAEAIAMTPAKSE
jgi:oxygen-dependent protoporphyrinogen oxidase